MKPFSGAMPLAALEAVAMDIETTGLGNLDEIARLLEAHRLFMTLMLEQQSRDLEAGIPVSNAK